MSYQPSSQQPYPQQHPGYAPPPPAPKKRRNWPWILLMLVAAIFVIGIIAAITDPDGSSGNSPSDTARDTSAPAAKPAKPAGPARTMSDGVYQVGVDVQAGRYKTPGPPDDSVGICYWSRNKDDSGEFESIIANGTPQGPGSVTVRRGEFVELTGGCAWTKVG